MPCGPTDASVVVCAYTLERWDDLVAAVASVRAQEPPACELIVVIDHNPALLARARAEIDGATVVDSTGPRGLSGARNSGLGASGAGVVAFLDDDARAMPGWLAGLLSPFADPGVVGTGGRADAAWDTGRPGWFPKEFDWVVGCSYRGLPEVESAVRNPLGCSMAFRRSVFETVGGFRPEVGRLGSRPVGCEETELCIRASRAFPGSRIVHVPSAAVRHRVPDARARWSYFLARCMSEGRSKAVVAMLAGTEAGLSSERAYTLRVLPAGVVRGLVAPLRGDPRGPVRSLAIVLGLAATTCGYVLGRATMALRPSLRPKPGLGARIPLPGERT